MNRPFSQACENNKPFILEIIRHVYQPGQRVLEIGSGTAQHVLHFARNMPQVNWQPAELEENIPTLLAGLEGEDLPNIILPPLVLDVSGSWPELRVEGVFSSNCLHIMPASSVNDFFAGIDQILLPGGNLCVYGPFKYQGEFTTLSNADFDRWLKARDPRSGIRDFETVNALAADIGLELVADHAMPANNQLLHWRRPRG